MGNLVAEPRDFDVYMCNQNEWTLMPPGSRSSRTDACMHLPAHDIRIREVAEDRTIRVGSHERVSDLDGRAC